MPEKIPKDQIPPDNAQLIALIKDMDAKPRRRKKSSHHGSSASRTDLRAGRSRANRSKRNRDTTSDSATTSLLRVNKHESYISDDGKPQLHHSQDALARAATANLPTAFHAQDTTKTGKTEKKPQKGGNSLAAPAKNKEESGAQSSIAVDELDGDKRLASIQEVSLANMTAEHDTIKDPASPEPVKQMN